MLNRAAIAALMLLASPSFANVNGSVSPVSLTEKQISDLQAGRGMGLALPAELNGYPGPTHVLEHADSLRLSPDQRAKTKALYDSMKLEVVPIGLRLIELEARMDALFVSRTATEEKIQSVASQIGVTQGDLRAAHLSYHLEMLAVLTLDQVERYYVLRGRAGPKPAHSGAH